MAGKAKETLAERFNRKYELTPEGCWRWTDGIFAPGYGKIAVWANGIGKPMWAHRVSYELHKGSIPDGLEIDHLCRNRWCVNPEHLEAVTHRENVLRGNAPAAISVRTNRCIRGHEFTPENTIINSSHKGRQCKACVRQWQRAKNRERGCGVAHKEKTHCKHGHEFSPENTLIVRERFRACLTCIRAHRRKRNVKEKQLRAERWQNGAIMQDKCKACSHIKATHYGGEGKCQVCGCSRYINRSGQRQQLGLE